MVHTHSAANLYDRTALHRLYQRNPSLIVPLLLRLRPSLQVQRQLDYDGSSLLVPDPQLPIQCVPDFDEGGYPQLLHPKW